MEIIETAILVSMATETAIQDPRKHALEALKRRFAFVEADLLQQKNKKSIKEGDGKEPHRTLADKTDAAVTPSFDAQHKKGIFFLIKKKKILVCLTLVLRISLLLGEKKFH